MSRPLPLALASAALLLLALAGADLGKVHVDSALAPAATALAVPPLGQELVRMFGGEKSAAVVAGLPAILRDSGCAAALQP
jgi:hypothetical protein